MPWTFAHPAAVLPLKRYTPQRLDFPALVVGSLVPDLCYYLQWNIGRFTHTLLGSVVADIPMGAALLLLFYWLRAPVCFLLPGPQRQLLLPLAEKSPPNLRRAPLLAASLLLGAWTHNFWDSLTHSNVFLGDYLPLLRAEIFLQLPLSFWLHQLSTFLGVLILCLAYNRWLRKERAGTVPCAREEEPWRRRLLIGLILLSGATAIPCALHQTGAIISGLPFRRFIFLSAVYSTMFFFPLLAGCALWIARKRGKFSIKGAA